MTTVDGWKDTLRRGGFVDKDGPPLLLQNAISAFLHQHQQRLTDIQSRAIEPIYSGENAILVSGTASGKTEAVVIPLAARICEDRENSLCIYVAPTRALLNDLHRRLEVPLHRLGIKVSIRHGDRPLSPRTQESSLLLTTPESLDVLLCKRYPFLERVTFVVCDEIHQVLGTPRGLQLLFLLQRLKQLKPEPRVAQQRVALSATLGNPDAVGSWFSAGEKLALLFSTDTQRPIVPEFHWLDRHCSLRDVISASKAKKVLVFVNSRRMCDDVCIQLRDMLPYQVLVHYSTLDRRQREYVESQFKVSEYAVCVATSTLELGIDIGSIEATMLFEPPHSVASLLQRVGRSGRRGEQTWAIMTPKNNLEVLSFCALTSLAREGLVEDVAPGHFYSVIVQQVFSYIASKRNYRIHEQEIEELCKPFPWVEAEDVNAILTELSRRRYLRPEPEWSSYQMGTNLETLFNDSAMHSNISDGKGGIPVFHQGRLLATLQLQSSQLRLGAVILYGGRFWEITSIGENRVVVRLTKPISSPIRPMYGRGGGNYTSSLVAQRIKAIVSGKVGFGDGLDAASQNCLAQVLAVTPSSKAEEFVLEHRSLSKTGYNHCYYTFAGGLENTILQVVFSERGHECQLMKDGGGIAMHSSEPLDLGLVPDDEKAVRDIVSSHWHRFQPLVAVGPFHGLLPSGLKKKEVLSQVLHGSAVPNVVALSKANVVRIASRLF